MTITELIKELNKADQTVDVVILDKDDQEKHIVRVEVYDHEVIIVED